MMPGHQVGQIVNLLAEKGFRLSRVSRYARYQDIISMGNIQR